MIADITLGTCTFIGVKGNNIEEIKDKIAYEESLSDYGKNLLVIKVRNKQEEVYLNRGEAMI